jgi:hypothetical protein
MNAQDIVDAATQARTALAALEQALASRIDQIEGAAFDANRGFTAAETAERDRLRAGLSEVRDGFRELSFVTLQQLDDSTTLQHLLHDMNDVNSQIKGDLDRLRAIAQFANTAAEVADALAKVVAGLASLAATVA